MATLATTDDQGQPHASAVHFVVHKDLTLYFTTRVEARKFKNLVAKPTVAMAITDEAGMVTVQLTGKAERVESLKTEQMLLMELWSLRFNEAIWPIPAVQMFEQGATNRIAVIKIVPLEMTYATFKTQTSGKYQPFFLKVI